MRATEIIAENRLAAALAAGAFEELPGRGAPLPLEDDSAVAAEWRIAFRLLRAHGFAPTWIEEARQLRAERARLILEVTARSQGRKADAGEDDRARVLELNRRIAGCNVLAPGPRWHIAPIDLGALRTDATTVSSPKAPATASAD
jgi:hypothetical protein